MFDRMARKSKRRFDELLKFMDSQITTAFRILDKFFETYPEQKLKTEQENIQFIETLDQDLQLLYKSAILCIAKNAGWSRAQH